MNGINDPWQRLAAAAQAGAEPRLPLSAPAESAWAATVARRALAGAALGEPSLLAQLWARLRLPHVAGPMAVLLVGGALWLAPPMTARHRAEARYEQWAGATLRQLRTWLPGECEQSGQIGLILRDAVVDLKRGNTGPTNVLDLLSGTQARIAALLTPEQRAQFEAEQRRLRERWFGPDQATGR